MGLKHYRRSVALVVLTMLMGGLTAASAGPVGHRFSSSPTKVKNATFGAAPSSAKGPDGRPYLTFNTTPGGQTTDHVAITNYSHRPLRVTTYTVDAVPDTRGAISFPLPDVKRRDAGAWMSVGTPHGRGVLTLQPRSVNVLPVHVHIPMNAPPGDHVGGVVVSLAGKVKGRFGQGSTQNEKFLQRIAVRAVFRVTGPIHPRVDIRNLTASYDGPVNPFARGDVKVSYVVHNGGNVVFGGPQSVSVHGLFGEDVSSGAVASIPPLLPGASYPVVVTVPNVYPELLMNAKVTVNPEGLQGAVDTGLKPTSSSVHFLAIPWLLLLILLLLIVGLAFRYWWRKHRRQAGRHRIDPPPATQPQGDPA
ncbi:MAG: hypothetical protein JO246_08005 [Frankiaceae bacterium]|nr:hypothetical protein [Frankiaceae bacterium]MBV9869951.1 hypothetical protein [Frankiaceae bacterium]